MSKIKALSLKTNDNISDSKYISTQNYSNKIKINKGIKHNRVKNMYIQQSIDYNHAQLF